MTMSLDQVTGVENLYIGGIFTLKRQALLHKANVTHVLSVLSHTVEPDLVKDYKHLSFILDDTDDEDILQYFPKSNIFIKEGLDSGGGVLVHCMMGKSRSSTIICAFLMNQDPTKTPIQALDMIKQCRSIAEPNAGFMDQLHLYYRMGSPDEIDTQPIYQRWLFERLVNESVQVGQAPADIRFEDEVAPTQQPPDVRITCRKCRRALASSPYLIQHTPKESSATTKALRASNPITSIDTLSTKMAVSEPCAHLFLDPLSWMKEELEQGKLEGRLECPKCKSNVGKYAWQGLRCTCNAWVVPGISLARSRVDELKSLPGIRSPLGKI